MHIASLFIYPIKSCGGIAVEQFMLDYEGAQYDHQWMIVDHDGQSLTQKTVPRLALIQTAIRDGGLEVSTPDGGVYKTSLEGDSRAFPLRVFLGDEQCWASEEHRSADQMLSAFLGRYCRLVRSSRWYPRIRYSDARGRPVLLRFQDGYPLHIITKASLADFKRRAPSGQAMTMGRLRPSIVVAGCRAYAEDRWPVCVIGRNALEVVKRTGHCVIPQINQRTGCRDRKPLHRIGGHRRNTHGVVEFGVYGVHMHVGQISVGDEVQIVQAIGRSLSGSGKA